VINPLYAQTLFNHIYAEVDGYNIAALAQGATPGSREALLYGEIPFKTWQAIVKRANPKSDAVFFDLGSGTGRVVFQSHLLYNFKKSIGVELLDGLHFKALELEKNFNRIIKPQVAHLLGDNELRLIHGNILHTDLHEADFILLPHPFKKEEDFLVLEEKFLTELKPKTKIVTLIRDLRNPAFTYLGFEPYEFSWGKSTAYFYETK
jgi:hypothetical protein